MQADKKSTGWKIPLLFCAMISAIVGLLSLFQSGKPKIPELPAELLQKASSVHIDLKKSGEQAWQEKIQEAATGFQDNGVKEMRLSQIIVSALEQQLPEAACAAVIHIKDKTAREAALANINGFALASCDRLEWSVFAIHASSKQDNINQWAKELLAKWKSCTHAGKQD